VVLSFLSEAQVVVKILLLRHFNEAQKCLAAIRSRTGYILSA